jgi:hypothetical protein
MQKPVVRLLHRLLQFLSHVPVGVAHVAREGIDLAQQVAGLDLGVLEMLGITAGILSRFL